MPWILRARALSIPAALRAHFHMPGLFQPGAVKLVYTHYDRMIAGGAVPDGGELVLDEVENTGTPSLLARREMVVANIGETGAVSAAGVDYALDNGDMLYLSMGSGPVTFTGKGRFFLISAPAHQAHPSRIVRPDEATRLDLGSAEDANKRILRQYIHPGVLPTCQIVMGMTTLAPGSTWNTMPAHLHDRRSEIYLYFGMGDEAARLPHDGRARRDPPPGHGQRGSRGLAVVVDPLRFRHRRLQLHLGHGRRQCRLHRHGSGGHGGSQMSIDFTLARRRALVTGASTGIGQAIAIAMAEAGADVVCVDRVPSDETLARIAANGGRAAQVAVDLTRRGAIAELMTKAGAVDILVNCAGIIRRADALDFTEEDWDQVMEINLKVVFFLSQAFARALLGRGGTGAIVNIASLLSFQGGIRVPSYTASKSGVAGLTKLLANEWAAKGINVNAIAPGYIATNNTAPLRADAERSKAILDRIPAGRWGEPEDIAGAAVFLASPAARYVHGAIFNVDGGWLAR